MKQILTTVNALPEYADIKGKKAESIKGIHGQYGDAVVLGDLVLDRNDGLTIWAKQVFPIGVDGEFSNVTIVGRINPGKEGVLQTGQTKSGKKKLTFQISVSNGKGSYGNFRCMVLEGKLYDIICQYGLPNFAAVQGEISFNKTDDGNYFANIMVNTLAKRIGDDETFFLEGEDIAQDAATDGW